MFLQDLTGSPAPLTRGLVARAFKEKANPCRGLLVFNASFSPEEKNSSEHLDRPKTLPPSLVTEFQGWPPTVTWSFFSMNGGVGVTQQPQSHLKTWARWARAQGPHGHRGPAHANLCTTVLLYCVVALHCIINLCSVAEDLPCLWNWDALILMHYRKCVSIWQICVTKDLDYDDLLNECEHLKHFMGLDQNSETFPERTEK